MKSRRSFLKNSALGMFDLPLIQVPEGLVDSGGYNAALVKQPEECETVFVREGTPITFNVSKFADSATEVSLLTEELLPGGIIPEHKHLNEDEFFFFAAGSGTVIIDGATFAYKPGSTAFIPKNTWHSIKNTGAEKAVFYFGYSPAGFEGFFKEIGTPKGQPFKQKPKDEFDAIAKKYGMVFK